MNTGICIVPVSPLRSEASHKTEMVSQLLFGELCVFIEEKPNWIKVKCSYDNYEGWCQSSHVTDLPETIEPKNVLLSDGWISEIIFDGQSMQIPMGSSLPTLKNDTGKLDRYSIQYKGNEYAPSQADYDDIKKRALLFLNVPYLWGGKSVFGIDCSGFCQTIYKFCDIRLKRDAHQQAEQGEVLEFLQDARVGDLAFFDNEERRIIHVGILLNDHEIIHASGKVRIDKIDKEGIINTDTGERTHKLRIIKRYF